MLKAEIPQFIFVINRVHVSCTILELLEELGGPAVSALSVRSPKLSNVLKGHRMGDHHLLFRVPPCFGRHVKLLVPAAFAVVSTHYSFKEGWRQVGRKNNSSLSQHDEKHVVPTPLTTPLSHKGRKKKKNMSHASSPKEIFGKLKFSQICSFNTRLRERKCG
jgi:hypothetical protein